MPLLAPTCTLTSQLGVNSGLNLPPKLIFPSIAVLPNLDFCNTLQCFSWFLQGGAVCCRIALGLLFCSSWTSLGRLRSPTWSLLGASWRVLGSSGRQLRSLGALLAALWTLLAALGTLLAALGTLLGRSWDALGTLLVALGRPRDPLGTFLARFRTSNTRFWTLRSYVKRLLSNPSARLAARYLHNSCTMSRKKTRSHSEQPKRMNSL